MRLPLLSFAFALALSSTPAVAQDHAHHAPPPASAEAAATRWATDAPLREGMRGIGAAVEALGHYEQGHMGPERAKGFAAQVQDHVRAIIASCKLPPEADAALHGIIAPLMANAAALEADPAKREAIAPMRAALADYARLFDDPQFVPPAAPAALD